MFSHFYTTGVQLIGLNFGHFGVICVSSFSFVLSHEMDNFSQGRYIHPLNFNPIYNFLIYILKYLLLSLMQIAFTNCVL